MVNKPFIRPYFWGGYVRGGRLTSHKDNLNHPPPWFFFRYKIRHFLTNNLNLESPRTFKHEAKPKPRKGHVPPFDVCFFGRFGGYFLVIQQKGPVTTSEF